VRSVAVGMGALNARQKAGPRAALHWAAGEAKACTYSALGFTRRFFRPSGREDPCFMP
jgi:hypothetical protein